MTTEASTAGCPPPGWRCESCGRDGNGLAVITVPLPGGRGCLTACERCALSLASGTDLPVTMRTAGRLVEQHRRHLEEAGTGRSRPPTAR
jgi:hypothetical protein